MAWGYGMKVWVLELYEEPRAFIGVFWSLRAAKRDYARRCQVEGKSEEGMVPGYRYTRGGEGTVLAGMIRTCRVEGSKVKQDSLRKRSRKQGKREHISLKVLM